MTIKQGKAGTENQGVLARGKKQRIENADRVESQPITFLNQKRVPFRETFPLRRVLRYR